MAMKYFRISVLHMLAVGAGCLCIYILNRRNFSLVRPEGFNGPQRRKSKIKMSRNGKHCVKRL